MPLHPLITPVDRNKLALTNTPGTVKHFWIPISALGLPDEKSPIGQAVSIQEAAVAESIFAADIKVQRRTLKIIAQQEGHMFLSAGVHSRDVLPTASPQLRHPPDGATVNVDGPYTAAMRMAPARRGRFFVGEVNIIHETKCTFGVALGRAEPRKAVDRTRIAFVDLERISDQIPLTIVGRIIGQTRVYDLTGLLIYVKKRDPRTGKLRAVG